MLPAVYSPPVVIVPPVALQVTVTLDVLLSLIRPTAVNCCVAPAATDAVAGVTSTARQRRGRRRDGHGRRIRLRISLLHRDHPEGPAVLPAVYNPVPEMVPPVSDQVTATLVVLPSLIRPTAVNCCVAPLPARRSSASLPPPSALAPAP